MRTPFVLNAVLVLAIQTAFAYQPGKFYYQGHTKEKVIALTFDDGPGAVTPQVLDFLKEHHARATFFILGDQVALYPQNLRMVREAGHELGNHTFYHLDYHKVKDHPAEQLAKELDLTEAAMRKALGDPQFKTKILRMPYGAYGKFNKAWLIPLLTERGYALVHWSFGTDWFLKMTPEEMASAYIKNAFPGAVFLMHDGGRHRDKTLAALKIVIPALEQKGYRFVAAEDLFKDE
jgi:peptidoglycan/xylan/chitin deacetylase (PgdA/CDA1 family)